MPAPSGRIYHGSSTLTLTSELGLRNEQIPLAFGVLVVADSSNTANVYIGGKGVTAGTSADTDGVKLRPGEGISIEIDNVIKVKVITATTGQKVWWMAL